MAAMRKATDAVGVCNSVILYVVGGESLSKGTSYRLRARNGNLQGEKVHLIVE